MNLKDKLVSSYLAFDDHLEDDSPIHEIRKKAIHTFEKKGFPTKKEEDWKYTSLKSILSKDYSVFPKGNKEVKFKKVRNYFLYDIDSYKLVFIDGVYSSFLSETTHDGLDICLLSAALSKSKYKATIENYYNQAASKNSITSLNTAFAKEGAYINIPKNKEVEKPIEIINFSTGNESALMVQPRNLIVVGENAHVQLIERHQSLTSNSVFTNSVTEVFAEKRAYLDYYKIQNDKENASLIDNTTIHQEQESNCKVHSFSLGGKLTRNNLNFIQNGEHCESTLKGVTILKDKQHVDQLKNAFDKRIITKSDYDVLFNSLELFSVIEHLKRLLGIKEFKSDSLSTPAVELFINNTGIESINRIGQEIEKSLSENSDLIQKLISELK